MLRVFHIITHFDLGGAERVAINIAKSKQSEIDYHIIEVVRGNSAFTQQLTEELTDNHIKYHRSPITSKKLGIVLFPFWFLFIYLKYRPSIIHTHTEIPDLSIYLFHFLYPWHKRYVRTIHNTELWNNWKRIGKMVERFFIDNQSNVAISKSVQECYIKEYHFSKLHLIYNGIEKKKQKTFPYLKTGKINVLFAGRLEEQKGITTLVEVVNKLKDCERYFFHIVGSGSLKNELLKLNGENFRLYDKIYDLASYMSSFDYLFMPSVFEGLSLTAIEASMSRTPSIINYCKGLKEVFPMNWLLKVENNSVDEFVKIFENQLPVINRDILAEIAYRYAHEHFSIEQMQQQYEKLYYEKAKN